jgi:hypothetical protein
MLGEEGAPTLSRNGYCQLARPPRAIIIKTEGPIRQS